MERLVVDAYKTNKDSSFIERPIEFTNPMDNNNNSNNNNNNNNSNININRDEVNKHNNSNIVNDNESKSRGSPDSSLNTFDTTSNV